jgi:hypothetical protein
VFGVVQGRIVYVPQSLWDEAELIRQKKGLHTKTAAFGEIANYSALGREAEKLTQLFGLSPLPLKRKK